MREFLIFPNSDCYERYKKSGILSKEIIISANHVGYFINQDEIYMVKNRSTGKNKISLSDLCFALYETYESNTYSTRKEVLTAIANNRTIEGRHSHDSLWYVMNTSEVLMSMSKIENNETPLYHIRVKKENT